MRLFIVNPMSSNGRGREVWQYARKVLEREEVPYQVAFTNRPSHATEITQNAITKADLQAVIAVGGDGTVHEIGNVLAGTHIPLGHIPAGTGNDFALAHRIPFDPIYAVERVLNNRIKSMDTADLGKRKMIGFMGIGFDGKVAEKVSRSPWKKWLCRLTYGLGALQILRSFQPDSLVLTVDGKRYEYDQVWLVAIANIPNYAGGMEICPQASVDDGLLDVCCVRNITHMQFLKLFPSVYQGKHIDHPSVIFHRGKDISIQSESLAAAHVDGEIIEESSLTVKVNPQSLLVL